MLGKIGLIIIAVIQIATAITLFSSSKQDEMFGMKMLTKELSIFRYLLSSLWISVSVIYVLGALNSAYFMGATTLGIVNIVLEIISYWAGFSKNRNMIKYYPPISTIVMAIPLILIVLNLLNK
jgi:hypothetical protein